MDGKRETSCTEGIDFAIGHNMTWSTDPVKGCPYELRENSIQSSINCRFCSFKFRVNRHNRAMQLTQFLLVGFILFTMTWRSESVSVTQSSEYLRSIGEDLGYILTTCYGDRIRGVGLVGDVPETVARILSTEYLIPVTLIEKSPTYTMFVTSHPVERRQPLPVFIVEVSSQQELGYTIEKAIRSTIFWNHMASFFILDRSPQCINCVKFLHTAWTRDVLNAKVFCSHPRRVKKNILTCNPYTSQAPAPWKRLADLILLDHPFSLFGQVYKKNDAICENLDFDKTGDIGGYTITVKGDPPGSTKSTRLESSTHEYQYWSTRDRVFQTIICSLNATPYFTSRGTIKDPIDTDMRQAGRLMLYVWALEKITYPHTHTGFVLISKFRGHKTQLEKILYVIDFNSRLGMGIVYLITLMFFIVFVRQALVPALLNLVRITCNTGFTNLPDKNVARIFLGCLLFFVVTMQGIYQGNLAALLTTNIPLQNINVLQDVVDLDYRIYGTDFMATFVKQHPKLEERFTEVQNYYKYCLAHVLNDSSAACLWVAQGEALDSVRALELHTSSEFVATFYSAYEMRWDWPLEQRVNMILSRMVEADVIPPWEVKCRPLDLNNFKYDKEVLNNREYKVIELAELTFAFVILGIGLVCATIVFVVEVAIWPT